MKKKILLTAIVLTILFIPKMVNAKDKIHFVSLRDGDGIIIETNVKENGSTIKHCGLVDAGYPNLKEYEAAGTGKDVKEYVQNIGCNYFDFVIMTHNHSDHIGGIPLLKDYFNSNTIVFYKTDQKPEDDDEEEKGWDNNKYFNDAMEALKETKKCEVRSAYRYTNNLGVITNLNNSFIGNIKYTDNTAFKNSTNGYDTNVRRNIYFKFGNFNIKIYALHILSNHNENLNSLVTLVEYTAGTDKIQRTAVLTGDIAAGPVDYENPTYINEENPRSNLIQHPTAATIDPLDPTKITCKRCEEIGPENQVADVIMYELGLQNITRVDLLKSAHHGYRYSNSIYSLDKYEPRFYITPYGENIKGQNNVFQEFNESNIIAVSYLKNEYGTQSYFTSQAAGAVVAEFSNTNIAIKGYTKDAKAINKSLQDASGVTYKYYDAKSKTVGIKNGWIYSYGKNFNDTVWMYMNGGRPIINKFIYDNNEKYYMDLNGLMYTGWKEKDGQWYYFRKARNEISNGLKGSAVKGWGKIDNKWYYFTTEGKMVTGWKTIDGKKYYFTKGGDMVTGWKTIDGKQYHFADNGVLIQ